MAGKNFCELCGEAGLTSRLVPYQINTEEAIFICENSECVYPLGNPHVGSFVVCRKATEISNIKRKRKKILSKNNPENPPLESTSTSTPEQFINWENADALCWLDCTLSLLVHNSSLKNLISTAKSPNSLLKSVIDCYLKAQQLVLSDLAAAKKILEDIRHEVWTYLAPKMKCSLGVNDSPIFAIPLLLKENGVTLENCLQEYTWEFSCDSCGFAEKTRQKKHLVTFPNTPEDFNFEKAAFLRSCPKCKSADQKSTIVHEKMPDVVLLHFVGGLASHDYLDSKFMFNKSNYQLTQFLQYARNPDHFICWTKETNGTRWLELDDLKSSVCSWEDCTPVVPPSEVHVVVFEKIPSESCESQIRSGENKSGKLIHNTNEELVSTTEISQDKEDNISSCMEKLEVVEDVQGRETATGKKNLETKQIVLDLQQKMVSNESLHPASVSGTHDGDTFGRFPLKDCSNTPDNLSFHGKTVTRQQTSLSTPTLLQSSNEPQKTPLACRNTSPMLSSSRTSTSLEKSLINVTLKRYSCSKKFQPSLSNKRRALSSQFQPYVPKKQRLESQIVHNKPSLLDFDNASDSGYSSPSSVSSCGSASSTTSMETEQKMSINDDMEKMEIDDHSHENIAEELNKLLPDCLLDDHRKGISVDDDEQFIHNETMKLESVAQEQEDFIHNLLFGE